MCKGQLSKPHSRRRQTRRTTTPTSQTIRCCPAIAPSYLERPEHRGLLGRPAPLVCLEHRARLASLAQHSL